jgi:hypothetical protein
MFAKLQEKSQEIGLEGRFDDLLIELFSLFLAHPKAIHFLE